MTEMTRTAAEIAVELEESLTTDPSVTVADQLDEIEAMPEFNKAATRQLDPYGADNRFVLADGSVVYYTRFSRWAGGTADEANEDKRRSVQCDHFGCVSYLGHAEDGTGHVSYLQATGTPDA